MIGETVSHYKIIEKIGEGGMGEGYLAEDTALKQKAALKVLPEQFIQDRERLARFQREAQVLASLSDPHIAAIYGLEKADRQQILVLELAEGETLDQRISRGPLPVDDAFEIALQDTSMATKLEKFEPTFEEQINAIKHVVYEYANLMAAGHYSIHGEAPWRTNCDDAFLLGCRKVGDFLMNQKRSTKKGQELDDVLALDYLPENANRTWDLPIWINEWRDPMNKQLAHIAYRRGKGWDHGIWVPQLEQEFRKAWWDFREAIVGDEYNLEFEKQLAACQAKEGFKTIALHER